MKSKYPPTKTLAVDVDGTLLRNGELFEPVVKKCREAKAAGYRLMLWSARGREYAHHVASVLGVLELFDDVVSKPGFIIDDLGWSWVKYTRVVRLDDDVG